VVAVGDAAVAAPPLDIAVTDHPAPPRPWVGGVDGSVLDRLARGVEANVGAAVALVQLLRLNETLDVPDALAAESLAYGLLQAGPAHRAWLAGRGPARVRRASGDPVLVERTAEDIVTLTLNRPEVRNAYDARMRDALVEALWWLSDEPGVAQIHLRGAGQTFSSGGDLDEFGSAEDPVVAHLVRATTNAGAALAAVSSRLTAHVHGVCVGAGVELPAFASKVIAAPGTTFRLPELAMGLIPGAGGTVSIPRRIGRSRAAWLALSGEPIDCTRAADWGLVDSVTDGS
jgi:enoyl-CoA hydratase/carnithine racemase